MRSPFDDLARQRSRADFVLRAHARQGLDAWTPSAADLREGAAEALEAARALGLVVLASNLSGAGGAELPVHRHLVRELGAVRVGLIGLVGGRVPGAQVEEPVAAARRELAALAGRVDLVVCLSNLGIEADVALAGEVEGLDFILGAGDDRMVLRPRRVGATHVLQPYKKGEYLGLVRVHLRGGPRDRARGLVDELDLEDLERRQRASGGGDAAERARLETLRGLAGFRAVLRPLPEDEPEDEALRDAVAEQLARELTR